MLTKKEAINIINAAIENVINCNVEYECTIKHLEGGIIFEDKFGKMTLQYEIPTVPETED